jgi:hypothetical protein
MNNQIVRDAIFQKQLLECERKYIKQLLVFSSEETIELRNKMLNKNLSELLNVNKYLRENCNHIWIKDDDDIRIINFCNNCGLDYN